MAHANAGNSEELLKKKFEQKKFHLPVIGHFADRSVKFNSILPTMIFEACIGKIFKARNTYWEYVKGNHYIKYKAYYINAQESYTRVGGFNG
jgi:hypothetical protein